MFARWLSRVLLVLVRLPLARAISPVSVKGAKFFTEDGSQFYVKGVVYQRALDINETAADPLLDTDQCEIDAGLMKAIGVNTIRVYNVDTTGNHDGCMATFSSQGIHVWIDLPSVLEAINRVNPAYTIDMFDRYAAVIDTFAKYNNTLSFNAGDTVILSPSDTDAAPYIKAVVRDVRAYRDARGYRRIPISYTSTDAPVLQLPTMDYLACGDQEDTIEIFGMSDNTWCGNSSYQASGFAQVYTQFQHINIPALFASVGCIIGGPHTFGAVAAILGPVFPATFSGVVVYQWAEEINGYGLVQYSNSAHIGFPSTLVGYNNLGEIYLSATPVSTSWTAYTPTNSPPGCPAVNSNWQVSGSASIPTIAQLNIGTVTARTTYYSTLNGAETTTGISSTATSGNKTSTDGKRQPKSLSTGAIAGTAVGVVVAVSGLVLASFVVLRRRQKARNPKSKHPSSPHVDGDGHGVVDGYEKAELPVISSSKSELDSNNARSEEELDSNPVYAIGTEPATHELENATSERQWPVSEMPGSGPNVNELPDTGNRNASI